ncbi:MAG: class I SAM-dependent methyltransferase [Balneolaceae bacterium]|nr:class I SAM-dependent methyltransferase [Balneolaceae bacterium]MBO6547373.1 class I SAM-dependent methyltransferase [Balneolaceae bacterium]MBO6647680.1 class I SAM-dependent methyltransferase [Balneolaceae bacterium]
MDFTEDEYKEIAAQLRKPNGELGEIVAEKMNEGNLLMNQNTIKALNISDSDSILEIGMGNGFFVKDILSLADGLHYIGCDYSEDMVLLSQKVNARFIDSGSARFFHRKAEELPVGDSSIDILFTVNTLYFWEDHTAILSEFRRVLNQNGKLILSFRPAEVMELYPPTKYNFDYYSKEEAADLLKEYGLEVLEVQEFEEPPIERDGQSFPPKHVILISGISKT